MPRKGVQTSQSPRSVMLAAHKPESVLCAPLKSSSRDSACSRNEFRPVSVTLLPPTARLLQLSQTDQVIEAVIGKKREADI